MARTTFSGPVASDNGFIGDVTGNIDGEVTASVLVLPTSTAAAVGNIDADINTTGKVAGKAVVDLSSGLIYVATGTVGNSDWVASDGSTSVTPS